MQSEKIVNSEVSIKSNTYFSDYTSNPKPTNQADILFDFTKMQNHSLDSKHISNISISGVPAMPKNHEITYEDKAKEIAKNTKIDEYDPFGDLTKGFI